VNRIKASRGSSISKFTSCCGLVNLEQRTDLFYFYVPESCLQSFHFRHLRKAGALTANVKIDFIEMRIALHGFDVVKCRPLILPVR
jgi:hypothetical protein